jgi:N-acetylmuramic acid 6-phosphate etherase
MVDVQPSNIKLKQRSRNIIRSIVHASIDLTDDQLDLVIGSCNGNIKLALMTLMSGLDVTESAGCLQMAGGVLKRALETWEDEQNSDTPDSSRNSDQNSEVAAQNRDLVVCIDGGGSKCAVVIADCLGNTGRGEGGACNL